MKLAIRGASAGGTTVPMFMVPEVLGPALGVGQDLGDQSLVDGHVGAETRAHDG